MRRRSRTACASWLAAPSSGSASDAVDTSPTTAGCGASVEASNLCSVEFDMRSAPTGEIDGARIGEAAVLQAERGELPRPVLAAREKRQPAAQGRVVTDEERGSLRCRGSAQRAERLLGRGDALRQVADGLVVEQHRGGLRDEGAESTEERLHRSARDGSLALDEHEAGDERAGGRADHRLLEPQQHHGEREVPHHPEHQAEDHGEPEGHGGVGDAL